MNLFARIARRGKKRTTGQQLGGEMTNLKQKQELVNGEIRGFVSWRVGWWRCSQSRQIQSVSDHPQKENNKRGVQAVADSAVCPSGVSSRFLIDRSAVCWLR